MPTVSRPGTARSRRLRRAPRRWRSRRSPPSITGHLLPVSRPPVDAQPDMGGIGIAGALCQREAADGRTVGQLRQQAPLLRVGAGKQQCLGGEIGGGRERHRRDRAAEFFGQHAEPLVAQAGAAVLFRDCGTEPAHLGHLLPQRGCVRLRRLRAPGARPSAAIVPPGTGAPGRAVASGRRRSRSSWRGRVLPDFADSLRPRMGRAKQP